MGGKSESIEVVSSEVRDVSCSPCPLLVAEEADADLDDLVAVDVEAA